MLNMKFLHFYVPIRIVVKKSLQTTYCPLGNENLLTVTNFVLCGQNGKSVLCEKKISHMINRSTDNLNFSRVF